MGAEPVGETISTIIHCDFTICYDEAAIASNQKENRPR